MILKQKIDELHAEHQALRKQYGGQTQRSLKRLISPFCSSRSAQIRINEIKAEKRLIIQEEYNSKLSWPFHLNNNKIQNIGNQALRSNVPLEELSPKDLKDSIVLDEDGRVVDGFSRKYEETGFILKNDNEKIIRINPTGRHTVEAESDFFLKGTRWSTEDARRNTTNTTIASIAITRRVSRI